MGIAIFFGIAGISSICIGCYLMGIILSALAFEMFRLELKEREEKREYAKTHGTAPVSGGTNTGSGQCWKGSDDFLDSSLTDGWSHGESYIDSGWDFLGFGDD